MKPKDEYLFYMQKILDLTENIQDERLRQDIINAFLSFKNSIQKLSEQDFKDLFTK